MELSRREIAQTLEYLGRTRTLFAEARKADDISVSLSARVKRPGEALGSKPTQLSVAEDRTADEVDAWERLVEDAMQGSHPDRRIQAADDGRCRLSSSKADCIPECYSG
jgi:hypothetical protein